MGSWGTGSFENDDASDWVYELEQATDDSLLRATLTADLSEAPEGSCALAAAEVVAAALGKAAANLPKEVTAWVDAHRNAVSDDLLDLARRAVREVAGGGELRELWDEAADPGWSASVRDLDSRLG